jgi:hypothetical protein
MAAIDVMRRYLQAVQRGDWATGSWRSGSSRPTSMRSTTCSPTLRPAAKGAAILGMLVPLPVAVVVPLRRYFVGGLTAGSVKG